MSAICVSSKLTISDCQSLQWRREEAHFEFLQYFAPASLIFLEALVLLQLWN